LGLWLWLRFEAPAAAPAFGLLELLLRPLAPPLFA
jgi:hypothetical protein